ncbi:MAG: hypothetical protein SGILL_005999, partial [Bacillariaceae sp.]
MPANRRRQKASTEAAVTPCRSTRRSSRGKETENDTNAKLCNDKAKLAAKASMKSGERKMDSEDEAGDSKQTSNTKYFFDGVEYDSYRDLATAKRKRNEDRLKELGLWGAASSMKPPKASSAAASQRGIKRQKIKSNEPVEKRKSSRISGSKTQLVALDYYVNDWNRDNSTIVRQEGEDDGTKIEMQEKEKFFNGRVNDGSELTLEE